jgi:hypothetical protein
VVLCNVTHVFCNVTHVLCNVTHVFLPTKYFLCLPLDLLVTLFRIACNTTVLTEVLNFFYCVLVIFSLREVHTAGS